MKKTLERKLKIEMAFNFGNKAFDDGIDCAPCLDIKLMNLIDGPVGAGIEILKSWTKGWIIAKNKNTPEFIYN